MLGICAEDAVEGVAALKEWVSALQLPRSVVPESMAGHEAPSKNIQITRPTTVRTRAAGACGKAIGIMVLNLTCMCR